MATASIPWGDGTSDALTVTYGGSVGAEAITVASAPNKTVSGRTKVLTFKSQSGVTLETLTVAQGVNALLTLSGVQVLTYNGTPIIVNV